VGSARHAAVAVGFCQYVAAAKLVVRPGTADRAWLPEESDAADLTAGDAPTLASSNNSLP